MINCKKSLFAFFQWEQKQRFGERKQRKNNFDRYLGRFLIPAAEQASAKMDIILDMPFSWSSKQRECAVQRESSADANSVSPSNRHTGVVQDVNGLLKPQHKHKCSGLTNTLNWNLLLPKWYCCCGCDRLRSVLLLQVWGFRDNNNGIRLCPAGGGGNDDDDKHMTAKRPPWSKVGGGRVRNEDDDTYMTA